jgi:dsDNA-binding SOS-regulon protein
MRVGYYQPGEIEGAVKGKGASERSELDLYAHIENLCDEEGTLLAESHEQLKDEQRERLHAIAGELDRVWEKLRERAHLRGQTEQRD